MTDSTTILHNYSSLIQDTFNLTRLTEDRARPRKRALECLDTAVMEYISFAMPTGLKDWTPDVEHLKTLQPGQRMVGFMSSPDHMKLTRRRRRSYYNDDDDAGEKNMSWCPTSLFRLMRLGMVTPMVCSTGIHDHNMRVVFAGLFDSFLTPSQGLDASYAVCSFELPDYKKLLATDYTTQMRDNVTKHGLLLQSTDYDYAKVKKELLDKRLESLEVFLKGSTSWMLLDLPIGGTDSGKGFFKFPYAFGAPVRLAHKVIDEIMTIGICDGYYRNSDVLSEYTSPTSYSGLHAEFDYVSHTTESSGSSESSVQKLGIPADLRSGVLMALLYPGLLADHGVVSAYVMARAREGSSVADPRAVRIRDVDSSLQQTIWGDKVMGCRHVGLVPDALSGRILSISNPSESGRTVSVLPIDVVNLNDFDHQDIFDSIFGCGFVRSLTSKRNGALVRSAVNSVLSAHTPDALLEVYKKYRDALDLACPVAFYTGKSTVELLLGVGRARPKPEDTKSVYEYLIKVAPHGEKTEDLFANQWSLRHNLTKIYPDLKDAAIRAIADNLTVEFKASQELDKKMRDLEGSVVL